MNSIVVHQADGSVHKGFTTDFLPIRATFHLVSRDDPDNILEMEVGKLKAVFFVKDFDGDPGYIEKGGFDPSLKVIGKRLRITFKDGEVFYGITQAFHPNATGFFITPVDPDCNNIRAFIINASVKETEVI